MLKLPKLIVEDADLEIIRYIFARGDNLVKLDGQLVNSFDDFVKLCSEEPLRSRDSIRIEIVQMLEGG